MSDGKVSKLCHLSPKDSFLEQVQEENQWKMANPGFPEK